MRVLAVLAALLLFAHAQAQPLRYRVEVDAPRDMAESLRKGLALARFRDDPAMSEERLRRLADDAVREAREVAATEGHFSAEVRVDVDRSSSPWTVRVALDPGPRTRIAEVEIRFTGPAAQDPEARELFERVRDTWRLRKGEPFRQEDWEAAKREAAREMSRWRYAAARVAESQARIDPEAREARLEVVLDSGPPFRFGEVRVTGLRRYPDATAEHLSPIRAGDTYERDKVLHYQRRLLETGYFASVQAEIDTHPGLAEAAPLRVAVIEAPSQNFEAGVGYSTDAGPRAEARYSNQDVFDSAWRFKSGLRLDRKIQSLELNLDSPPQPRARWDSVFARARQADIQNETTRELAVGVSHNLYRGLAPLAFIVSGHLEEQRVAGSVSDNRHAIYFGHRHSFRSTDDLVLPRIGYLGTVEVGGSPHKLASQPFFRVMAGGSLLIPIGRTGDFLVRGQVGSVVAETREGVPTTFLFRTGGDQTVRGYAFESLGVRQGDAIVGGRRLAVAAAEYTHWLGESWGAAVFLDAGNAWDRGISFNPAFGYGVGARFRTPIGPIRADLAYGERTGEFRLHFSVGYTF